MTNKLDGDKTKGKQMVFNKFMMKMNAKSEAYRSQAALAQGIMHSEDA